MIAEIQVDTKHYDFTKYIGKSRWNSFYHQIIEIISTNPNSILEIGVGAGVLGLIMKYLFKYNYESMDIDEKLKPDHIGSVLEMPFSDKAYDVVGCFQVLEHLPYDNFERALSEIFRVAKKAVIISLPNAGRIIKLHIPKICEAKFIKLPFGVLNKRKLIKEHYWEINRKIAGGISFEEKKIIRTINEIAIKHNFILKKEYRVWENKYHHFFVLTRANATDG